MNQLAKILYYSSAGVAVVFFHFRVEHTLPTALLYLGTVSLIFAAGVLEGRN